MIAGTSRVTIVLGILWNERRFSEGEGVGQNSQMFCPRTRLSSHAQIFFPQEMEIRPICRFQCCVLGVRQFSHAWDLRNMLYFI
jgi:hypothetical protein